MHPEHCLIEVGRCEVGEADEFIPRHLDRTAQLRFSLGEQHISTVCGSHIAHVSFQHLFRTGRILSVVLDISVLMHTAIGGRMQRVIGIDDHVELRMHLHVSRRCAESHAEVNVQPRALQMMKNQRWLEPMIAVSQQNNTVELNVLLPKV